MYVAMKTHLLVSFFLTIFFFYAHTKEYMDYLYVDHLECDFNKDLCGTPLCKSIFYNRTTKLATISVVPIVPFETIKIQSSLHYRFTGGYRQFAINLETDWCKFMDGTQKSVLLDVFLKFIKGYANFDHKCPLTGNLSVSNLPMTAQIFGGQFIPAGDYFYQTILHINGIYGLTWKAYFNIPAGKTILDDVMGK